MALRLDDTGFGGIRIYQDPDAFCYGVDAVLLADFAARGILKKKKKVGRLIDLGTGTGIVPLILCHKTAVTKIWGLELQQESYDICLKNAEINDLSDRLSFIMGDVSEIADAPVKSQLADKIETFDVVTMNPPYIAGDGGIISGCKAVAIARHETRATLEDFMRAASLLLRDRGDLYMVHRPGRLVDICEIGRRLHMEPKELCFVSGKPEEKPNILLVHCVKNGNRELKMLRPMHVREKNGEISMETLEIYEKNNGNK